MRMRHARALALALLIVSTGPAQAAPAQAQLESQVIDHLRAQARPAADYLTGLFASKDVVLLGEQHAVKQHLEFVSGLLPQLHATGVHNLVMEFGAQEDQEALDALINADRFDEAAARQLMFNYNTMWSWQEYRDLYRAAWRLNRSLPAAAPRMRILNMSYRYDWRGFSGQRTPSALARIFHRGTPDAFRADLIRREILDRNAKALVLTGSIHALTRYRAARLQDAIDGFCAFDEGMLGNRLFRSHGNRIANVMFHQPLPGSGQPASGVLEKALLAAGAKGQTLGFDLRAAAPGALPDTSLFADCYPDFRLGDLFDGYLFIAPLGELRAATPDLDFVGPENLTEALEQFPDPDWKPAPKDLQGVKAHIQGMADEINRDYARLR